MRTLSLAVLLAAVVTFSSSCASTAKCTACADAQALVETVAKQHPDCTRLTLHCADDGGARCCASTMAERVGKPSDPEDLDAMRTGKPVVLDEAGAIDVTLPIRAEAGKFHSAVGVTLQGAGLTREMAMSKATTIAAAVEQGLKACGDCCCK